eukprot:TRINITY_DN2930_c4_g1_i1.p1 TRINITY_DN2930_c4_g1~~TRINITY_DN2930_c4_g1_i1.p1  ORF type:complete len:381 (+),score=81.20 TRINITY_DN2930_c4_g1_i1:40-1143(+)
MAGDAKIGDRVVVEGLKQSGMNGLEGTLLEIDATGRLVVSLDDMLGKHYSFKRENVHKATIHITNMPDKETTAEESDPNKTRRIYAVLILLCVVGFLYHKNTVSSRHERELRRLQEVHARTFDQAINDHIQNVDAKQLLAPTPQPTTFDDSLKNVFAKIATRFRSQLFKDGEYMCVRMSPGLLLSDAIAAHNVTWISFGQDAPQSEFMVRCYQSMVKMVDKTAASVNRQVYVVRDGDDTATLGTKEETMFLEDAMRWVVSRMSPATSICGDQHRLLESLQTADGILMQNTPNGCNFIERLICSQASLVMQFGGPRDTIATAGKGIYYPTCGDFSTRRRTAQDRDKDKDKDKEGTPDTTQEPMSEVRV